MPEKKPIYVIGHRNPDTDSICSAIAYARLKQALGVEDVVAARAGEVNAETRYALETFRVDLPHLLHDIYPRVQDVMLPISATISEQDSLRRLGKVMNSNNLRSVVVVNNQEKLAGIVSVSDLAKRYFQEISLVNLSDIDVTFGAIVQATDGTVLVGRDSGLIIKGRIIITSSSQAVLKFGIKEGDIIIVGDGRDQVMRDAIENKVACIIMTGDGHVSPGIQEAARQAGICIVTTEYDTYTTARIINQCMPVNRIMQKQPLCFRADELVTNIIGTMEEKRFRNYPVLDGDDLVGVISRDQFLVPEKTRLILVDHNELAQAVEGIDNGRIIEIIDHHRLGGITTADPIYTREEPVGCTATIITGMYMENGVDIPEDTAGLLLSAIISDTVLFKSPTTTDRDRRMAEKLAPIAGVDINEYGMNMLKAGSSVSALPASEIAKNDSKEFSIGGRRMLIGQISVMDTAEVLAKKAEITEAMAKVAGEEGYSMVMLMVTDIIKEGTELLYVGEPRDLIGLAFKKDASGDSVYLPGVMSRKKQIVPPLTEAGKALKG